MVLIELKVGYDRKNSKHKGVDIANEVMLARTYVYRNTLTWGTDGIRCMPVELFPKVEAHLLVIETDFRKTCAGLDKKAFYMTHNYISNEPPVEQLPPALRDSITTNMRQRKELALHDLRRKIWTTAHNVSDRLMIDFVRGEARPRRFHNTLITGIQDDAVLYHIFNDSGSFGLGKTIDSMQALGRYDAKTLRKNAEIRHKIQQEAQGLLDVLSKY